MYVDTFHGPELLKETGFVNNWVVPVGLYRISTYKIWSEGTLNDDDDGVEYLSRSTIKAILVSSYVHLFVDAVPLIITWQFTS